MILVSILSVVFLKYNRQKIGLDTDGGRKILWGDCRPSLLNSICNSCRYRKETH